MAVDSTGSGGSGSGSRSGDAADRDTSIEEIDALEVFGMCVRVCSCVILRDAVMLM